MVAAGDATGRGAPGLADVLVRVAGDRPGLVVITGVDPGPATWFAEVWPERVLTVPPAQARMAVAEGVITGGQDALVVLDAEATSLPLPPEVAVVVVSTTAGHLRLAHRAALAVMQPGWPEDLPAVLLRALDHDAGVLLHLPDLHDVPARPPVALPAASGGPRVLHRGGGGLVIGAGRTAAVAAAAGEGLAVRGRHVTALDLPVITAESRLDAALLHDHLLVGPADSPRAEALTGVPVDGQHDALLDRLEFALQQGRAR